VLLKNLSEKVLTFPDQSELCNNSSEYINGKEMEFISVRAKFIDAKATIVNMVMGDTLGKTNQPILEGCIPQSLKTVEEIREQSFENILKFDGVPVFVISN
jgi:hypothetical protein